MLEDCFLVFCYSDQQARAKPKTRAIGQRAQQVATVSPNITTPSSLGLVKLGKENLHILTNNTAAMAKSNNF